MATWWTSALSGPLAMFGMDTRAITRGMSFMSRPDAGTMLELMGDDTDDQVDAFAVMLRNSSEAEIAAVMHVFQQAMARAAAPDQGRRRVGGDDQGPSRPGRPTAADRRRDRRRQRRPRA